MNRDELKQELQKFREEKNVSGNRIAAAIGVSSAVLSQWMKDNYAGDNGRIDELVWGFLEREKEKAAMAKKETRFVKITAAKRIYETLRMAHLEGEIAVVYGEAGAGKTASVRKYAERHKDAILIEADFGYTAKILFRELHKRLGFDGKGTLHDMFEDVRSKLAGTGRLLIIDEAEHLPYRALELVRRLYDKAGIGVALVGMPRLIFNLRGRRGEYAQLYSRVGIACKVDELTEEDAKKIISAYVGDSADFGEFFKHSKRNTRHLTKLIYRSERIAKINNKRKIDRGVIKAAAELLLF